MPVAQAVLIIEVLAISPAIWWFWWQRQKEGGCIWVEAEVPTVSVHPIAVALTFAMIGISLAFVFGLMRADEVADKVGSINNVWWGNLFHALVALVLLPMAIGGDLRRLPGLGFGLAHWQQQIVEGMQTALASFLPVLGVLLITSAFRSPQKTHPLLRLLQQNDGTEALLAIVLAAVIFAPLVEELMFRVVLLGWLKTRTTSREAIVVSSLLFAAVHGPLDGLALVPLALLLGLLYDRRKSFWSVFVAHAFFNLWNIALTLSAR